MPPLEVPAPLPFFADYTRTLVRHHVALVELVGQYSERDEPGRVNWCVWVLFEALGNPDNTRRSTRVTAHRYLLISNDA